jgi:hypothetical protein
MVDYSKVTRIEVINHGGVPDAKIGRLMVLYGVRVEPSVQDGGRTLKLFLYEQGGYGHVPEHN